MDSVVREEITPYQISPCGLPEEAAIHALQSMDWEAYEKRMEGELKEAIEAYAKGERGTPARDFFDDLYHEDAEVGAVG